MKRALFPSPGSPDAPPARASEILTGSWLELWGCRGDSGQSVPGMCPAKSQLSPGQVRRGRPAMAGHTHTQGDCLATWSHTICPPEVLQLPVSFPCAPFHVSTAKQRQRDRTAGCWGPEQVLGGFSTS